MVDFDLRPPGLPKGQIESRNEIRPLHGPNSRKNSQQNKKGDSKSPSPSSEIEKDFMKRNLEKVVFEQKPAQRKLADYETPV